jgi:hypothetical protein
VTQQLLNGADIRAALQQMGGEAVAEGVRCHAFREASQRYCMLNGLTQTTGVDMMAPDGAASWIRG